MQEPDTSRYSCDPTYSKQCIYCGDPFKTSELRKKYCSPSCKNCASSSRRSSNKDRHLLLTHSGYYHTDAGFGKYLGSSVERISEYFKKYAITHPTPEDILKAIDVTMREFKEKPE